MTKTSDKERNSQPLFSVTIPAYKKAFLKECIDSILLQTYTNFELVIVNDASPYDLDEIVNSYSDQRIHYYKNKKNYGAVNVVNNWNKCLEYAKGDYIICMGDDDRLTPICLSEYNNLINRFPGLGVYHTLTEVIDENSQLYDMQQSRPEFESAYSLAWHRWNGRNKQYIGDFCYDVRLLRANGGFYKLPMAWGSDEITAIIAAQKTGIANAQKIGFQYRVNPQTISKSGNARVKIEAINQERVWYESFLKKEPIDNTDKIYVKLLSKNIDHYLKRQKIYTIIKDISNGNFVRKLFCWIKDVRKVGLTYSEFTYVCIMALKERIK